MVYVTCSAHSTPQEIEIWWVFWFGLRFCFVCFEMGVLLWSPGWPGICDPPASASLVSAGITGTNTTDPPCSAILVDTGSQIPGPSIFLGLRLLTGQHPHFQISLIFTQPWLLYLLTLSLRLFHLGGMCVLQTTPPKSPNLTPAHTAPSG